jgi:hypothetical protein
MPRARGMAYPINKRTSHIFIQLDTIDNMPQKKSKGKMIAPKLETKPKVVAEAKKAIKKSK